jgi:hypothetical protein
MSPQKVTKRKRIKFIATYMTTKYVENDILILDEITKNIS